MQGIRKGISMTVIGLIFGMFELTIVLVSPIYGTFVSDRIFLTLL